jgi:hypothetical protein
VFVGERRGALGKIACLLVLGLLGALIVTPHAHGQAATDQYVQPPVPGGGTAGQVGGGGTGGTQGGADAGGVGAVAGETGSGGGGTLPFTGYPVTALVIIALALLCAGILARLGLQAARRIRA